VNVEAFSPPAPQGANTGKIMPIETDSEIRDVLSSVKTVAVVGASNKADRPAHYVPQFVQSHGYRVIPVNPGQVGTTILGETVYASLSDIPEPIDMVEVFRAPEHVGPIVDEMLTLKHKPKVLWTQIGVVNPAAEEKAEQAGITVVSNRCPKVEIPRLSPKTPA
jgi:predicted CoA-binding protein